MVYSPEPCADVYCMRLWEITTEFVGFINNNNNNNNNNNS